MQNKIPVLLGIATGALLGVVVSVTWLASRQAAPGNPPATAEVEGDSPSAQPESRETGRDARPLAHARGGHSGPALPERAPTHAEILAETVQTFDKHETLWAQDALGDVESARLEQRLHEVMESPRFKGEVRALPERYSASCKRNACRIESTFPQTADADSWLSRMLMDMGTGFGNSTTVALPEPGGAMKVVVFAYRPGRQPN